MSSEETKPRSVMSRSKDTDKVVSGGRPMRYHRVTSWTSNHHSIWPPKAEGTLLSSDQPASKRQKRMRVPPTGTNLVDCVGGEETIANVNDGYKVAFEKKMRENERRKNVLAEKVAIFKAREKRRGGG